MVCILMHEQNKVPNWNVYLVHNHGHTSGTKIICMVLGRMS
jgi:hypothetical protein